MASNRILVKGGHVLTMDPEVGDLPGASILVEDDRIVRIDHDIEADAEVVDADGMIVLPGMVDTHRHTWQSLLRGLYADASLIEFFASLRMGFNAAYTAEDVHIANLIGALDAIESGVTTILDYSHCLHTPDHADAAVGALAEAGIRAVYGYGLVQSHGADRFTTQEQKFDDARRVASTYLSSNGLLTRGLALSEMGLLPFWDHAKEIRLADELDAVVVTHTGAVWGTDMARGIRELARHDLLRSSQVHVHCCALDDEEWQLLADAGAKVSFSPDSELGMGQGRPPIRKALDFGIKPTLSCDITSMNSGDILTQARMGLQFQRCMDNDPICFGGGMPVTLSLTCRDALEWATVNGAEACGLGGRVGMLKPGMQADLLLVGGDTMNMFPAPHKTGTVVLQANPANIRTVMVAGRVLKRDGTLVGVDVRSLRAKAEAAHERLFAEVGVEGVEMPALPPGFLDMMNPVWSANIAQADQPEPA